MTRSRALPAVVVLAAALASGACTGPAPGASVPARPASATLPPPLPEDEAISGATNPLTVLWVAVSTDPDELADARDRVAAAGAEALTTPLSCQAAAGQELLTSEPAGATKWGVPLYYQDPADAEAAAVVLGEPVAGIVTGDVFCHFD